MATITLLQDIKDLFDSLFKRIVRLKSRELNSTLLHLSKTIEEFTKARKKIKSKEKSSE